MGSSNIASEATPRKISRTKPRWVSWFPVPFFITMAVIAYQFQPRIIQESKEIVSILYTLFCAGPAILVALLAGQTFLQRASLRMLSLGMGAIFFSIIYIVAVLFLPDYNAGVTIHNFGFMMSGAGFLLSSLLPDRLSKRIDKSRLPVLILSYLAVASMMTAWVWAAYHNLLPRFYHSDLGYTPLRHAIIGSGIIMYAATSVKYQQLYLNNGSRFQGLFSQSVALIGAAMLGAVFIPAGGTGLAWIVRLMQCVGGIYMALAILRAVQDSGAWRIPLEKALQQNELRYRSLFSSMTEGFALHEIITDDGGRPLDYRFLEVNPAFEKMTRLNQTDLIGRRALDVLPGTETYWIESYGRVAMTGEPAQFENYSADLGRWYEVFAYRTAPMQFATIMKDITERKRAEETLKESEERFRTMADGLPLIVWVHDAEGNQQFVNQTFLEYFETTHDEMKDGRWQMFMHPDDAQGYADEFLACVRDQRVFHQQVRVRRDNGQWRWIESWARPRFTPSGKYLGHVGTSADITERKQAEEALVQKNELLENIYRHIPVLLVLWDPNLERFLLNRQTEKVMGYSTAEANEGDFMSRIYPDDAYREEVSAYMESLETGWREWIGTTKNGETVPIEWANIQLSDNTRIGIGVDMRERKKAEAALRESHRELNEYTYALTHNIKAPFRAVQNYANFLLEDLADTLEGEPLQFLDGMQRAIGLAHQQFVDLEALYQVKDHPLEFESLDMRELLGEIAALHDGMPDRDLVIQTQWPPLWGERFLLRQILMALVSNGFKYNRSEIKRVEVTWRHGADRRFEILVSDNGIGIDPQYHEHILHIFKRLHTEEEYEGTGIGLAIVRRAVKRLGGDLQIESAVGKGSTFVVILPASMVEGGPQAHHPWSIQVPGQGFYGEGLAEP